MASLKEAASNVLYEARDAIAWIAVWKNGRSWHAEAYWPMYDEHKCYFTEIEDYELAELHDIIKEDPRAIFVNGYYYNLGSLEEMTLNTLTNALRWHYEQLLDAQLEDALLSLDDAVKESAAQ